MPKLAIILAATTMGLIFVVLIAFLIADAAS